MGLCFGGGQLALGGAMTLVGLFIIVVLKKLERRLYEDHHAALVLLVSCERPGEAEVRRYLAAGGFRVKEFAVAYLPAKQLRRFHRRVKWHAAADANEIPAFVEELSKQADVRRVTWSPL
jgi:putative Mg2+ transporter-C (MgtC) family protein